ncbi:YceD family protein [Paracoccus xiamenensis]|uniref:YceD family protein n=1 Tax=Paracoccus xiamenensis TaxID=2714901 RepID=UPI00140E59E2|nr:YceD family protein [Paracoccus xiamenensis]NHF71733.1 DUF177 domain-containing protein [Paracoccus xiamenensis]
MNVSNPLPERLRVSHLSPSRPNPFDLTPDATARSAIADELDLLDLPQFRFEGAIRASGSDAWALTGQLSATVVQACAITLAPVKTKLTEEVSLLFSPHVATPEEEEVEMGDETVEPLGQWIRLGDIALEALALALPPHPRAPGAELPQDVQDDGAEDEPRRPFAGLADLMKAKKPNQDL